MAGQSGYSKYAQGVQRLARNLWVKAIRIVFALSEFTSPQTACDARMLRENAQKPYFGRTEHFWQGNVTVWRHKLFNGGNVPSGYIKCGEFLDELQTS
jgi:hypothetical protein